MPENQIATLTSDDWREKVEYWDQQTSPVFECERVHPLASSNSLMRPREVWLSDGRRAWIKRNPPYNAQPPGADQVLTCSLYNDQVTARIGVLMGAPVAEPVLVQLTEKFVERNPGIALPPGIYHGTITVPELGPVRKNGSAWALTNPTANLPRFAQLAILYGLLHCTFDHQFWFDQYGKGLVWSLDHGYVIGSGEIRNGVREACWNADELCARNECRLDPVIAEHIFFPDSMLRQAARSLDLLSPDGIAECVSCVPAPWGVSKEEKISLAAYVWDRSRLLHGRLTQEGTN